MGFIQATPGDMKSFRSSAERMALIVSCGGGGVASSEVLQSGRRKYASMQERNYNAQQAAKSNTRREES